MKDRIALYPGTFDPPTLGHLDIIKRAASLCTILYVGLAENSAKNTMFSLAQREEMCKKICLSYDNIKVVTFSGLVVDFAIEHKVNLLIRGIRNAADVAYEMQMAQSNLLISGIETIFIPSNFAYGHINSTFVREIMRANHSLAAFLPPEVEKLVERKK